LTRNHEIKTISNAQAKDSRFLEVSHFPLGKMLICADDGNVSKSYLLARSLSSKATHGFGRYSMQQYPRSPPRECNRQIDPPIEHMSQTCYNISNSSLKTHCVNSL
jgi:hypothetical protein